jgi:hypothetical protein
MKIKWLGPYQPTERHADVEGLLEALECLVLYWDKWKDAPFGDPIALSLEEVVQIARSALKERK